MPPCNQLTIFDQWKCNMYVRLLLFLVNIRGGIKTVDL